LRLWAGSWLRPRRPESVTSLKAERPSQDGTGFAITAAFARFGPPCKGAEALVESLEDTYYSDLDSTYHTFFDCPVGRSIPAELRHSGSGGRLAPCPACEARLEARRRQGDNGN
jgi:hypothetical protein